MQKVFLRWAEKVLVYDLASLPGSRYTTWTSQGSLEGGPVFRVATIIPTWMAGVKGWRKTKGKRLKYGFGKSYKARFMVHDHAASNIHTRADFVRLVHSLAQDFEHDPGAWENNTLSHVLEALATWLVDTE